MDLLNICRVCMAEKLEYFSIFDLSENEFFSFNEIISQISSVAIEHDDSLSKNICSTCRDSCHDFLRFRDLIQSSNEYQLQMAVKGDFEAAEAIEEVESKIEMIFEDEKEIEVYSIDVVDENLICSDDINDDDDESSEEESEGEFSCEKCNKRFEKEAKLMDHMKVHSPRTRIFPCKTCKRKFTTEILLQRHEIVHSDLITEIKSDATKRCIVCSQNDFKDKAEFEDHMTEHKEAAETEIACQHCDKVFNKLGNLIRHLKTHDVNKTHLCTVCNKTFAMGQELIDHANRHKGFTPHTCNLCNKSFLQLSKLKIHLRTHSNDKEFLCTECGKSFNRASNLRQHILRHTGEKKFICSLCPAKFVSKGNLNAHMAAHTSKKPYSCKICGSSFTQSYSLVKHNRIHNNDRPFQCEFCEQKFYSSDHLKRHHRTHTGEKVSKILLKLIF